jgi:hypothetical protein
MLTRAPAVKTYNHKHPIREELKALFNSKGLDFHVRNFHVGISGSLEIHVYGTTKLSVSTTLISEINQSLKAIFRGREFDSYRLRGEMGRIVLKTSNK